MLAFEAKIVVSQVHWSENRYFKFLLTTQIALALGLGIFCQSMLENNLEIY